MKFQWVSVDFRNDLERLKDISRKGGTFNFICTDVIKFLLKIIPENSRNFLLSSKMVVIQNLARF